LFQITVVDVSYPYILCSLKRQVIFEKYVSSPFYATSSCWCVDSDRNCCIMLSPTQEKVWYLSFN